MKEHNAQGVSLYGYLKKKHPDALLLFRTRDFYEAYKEDAYTASTILYIPIIDEINVHGGITASLPAINGEFTP